MTHYTPCINHRACPLCDVRNALYTGARILGDVRAIERGPGAIVKRLERKAIGRVFGSLLRRFIP